MTPEIMGLVAYLVVLYTASALAGYALGRVYERNRRPPVEPVNRLQIGHRPYPVDPGSPPEVDI